jgi:hypothetical protein
MRKEGRVYLLALEEIGERQVLAINALQIGLAVEQVLAHSVGASEESLAAAHCERSIK